MPTLHACVSRRETLVSSCVVSPFDQQALLAKRLEGLTAAANASSEMEKALKKEVEDLTAAEVIPPIVETCWSWE